MLPSSSVQVHALLFVRGGASDRFPQSIPGVTKRMYHAESDSLDHHGHPFGPVPALFPYVTPAFVMSPTTP